MTGPVTFITGGASGIGRHLVSTCSGRGDLVCAADIDELRLKEVAETDRWPSSVLIVRLDVTDPDSWELAFSSCERHFGKPVSRLVNNAGVLAPDWIAAASDHDIHRQIDVNVKGVIFGTRAAARRMIENRSGHIVNIGSLASLAPVPGLSLYSASKFAVRGFSLSVALELEPHGVAVTVVMPDAVDTPMLDLQRPRPEAALTFSGGRPLTTPDIDRALIEVFRSRPLEYAIPTHRGALARAANLAPALGRHLGPLMRALGRRNQQR
jgi:3-oxoacyl-[acyl-carrier protein] reductase